MVVIIPALLLSASMFICNLHQVDSGNEKGEPSKTVSLKKWKKNED